MTSVDDEDGPHHADRALAAACLANDAGALAALDADGFAAAATHARASGFAASLVDEAVQIARVRLLVGDGDRPAGLTTYRGRGSLAAFVKTIVTRIAIDLSRATRPQADVDVLDLICDETQSDPELELMRRELRGPLREALRTAWRELATHDRFVLGLQLHEKLDEGAIAKLYQVHRATAARRVATARASLLELARRNIRAQLGVGDETVDSILRIITTSVAWSAVGTPA